MDLYYVLPLVGIYNII